MKNQRHFSVWPARLFEGLHKIFFINVFTCIHVKHFYVIHHYCSCIAVFYWLYSTAVKPMRFCFSQQQLGIILSCRC